MSFDDDYRRGRRLLRDLLPWARAMAKKELARDGARFEFGALGRAQAEHIKEENLDALMIYPAPLGGWHSDILFKNLPPGVPNSMGSQVAHPLRTRDEAEAHGKRLLLSCLLIEQRFAATVEPSGPAFLLFGLEVRLVPEMLEMIEKLAPKLYTYERAANRLTETVAACFPNGCDEARYRALSRDDQSLLMFCIHIAAVSGIFAFPLRRDGPPATNGGSETSQ